MKFPCFYVILKSNKVFKAYTNEENAIPCKHRLFSLFHYYKIVKHKLCSKKCHANGLEKFVK